MLLTQRKEVAKLRKKLKLTQGHEESKIVVGLQKQRLEKLQWLRSKAARISTRINQMQPSGWKEFLQVLLCPLLPLKITYAVKKKSRVVYLNLICVQCMWVLFGDSDMYSMYQINVDLIHVFQLLPIWFT